jgi:exosortase H (IPTLxxWG-CTERM-specific)
MRALPSPWRNWFSAKAPVFLFALKFGGLIALLYAVLATPVADRLLYHYLEFNAWLANGLLVLLGEGTRVSEVTIHSPGFAIAVRRGCDAVEPTWLLCAAILAFPASWRYRMAGIAAGVALLQALNLVRIVTLFLVGEHLPTFFHPAHLELWPAIFILAAILLFGGWRGRAHVS